MDYWRTINITEEVITTRILFKPLLICVLVGRADEQKGGRGRRFAPKNPIVIGPAVLSYKRRVKKMGIQVLISSSADAALSRPFRGTRDTMKKIVCEKFANIVGFFFAYLSYVLTVFRAIFIHELRH